MAQAQVEMAVAIAWAARAAEAEAEAAWLRLQPSPEGGPQPSLGRTTWRATEAPRFARSEEVRLRATRTSDAFVHRLRKKKSVSVSSVSSRSPRASYTVNVHAIPPPTHEMRGGLRYIQSGTIVRDPYPVCLLHRTSSLVSPQACGLPHTHTDTFFLELEMPTARDSIPSDIAHHRGSYNHGE
jgi:hypothetical protein